MDLFVVDVAGHPRLKDDAAHPPERGLVLPTAEQAAIDLVQGDKITKLENPVANRLPQNEDGQSVSSQIRRRRLLPPSDTLSCQWILRDFQRSQAPNFSGAAPQSTSNVRTKLPRSSFRGMKSLSTSAVSESVRPLKRKGGGSLSVDFSDALEYSSCPYYHSRRDDIMRGYAKVKVLEAAKNNCTAPTDT